MQSIPQHQRRICADGISILAHSRRKNLTNDGGITNFAANSYLHQPEHEDRDFENALRFAARVHAGFEDHQIWRLLELQWLLRQSTKETLLIDGFV